ncbi:hypothetical protein [Nocardia gipuzkoensis]|uniref:hypothetical protein n=1 Tax=Nocardia gipuzkoensis TaxID=2749991 RepID=UPI0024578EBC|nr:hypothetical protein [Nocardia gipuzkoensis]
MPDAVVLCGSSAGNPDIVAALRLGFTAPVIVAPDYVEAAAYGAALVAAAPFRSAPTAPPVADRGHVGRVVLAGAAAAALLGGAAMAVVQARENRPANAEIDGPVQVSISAPQLAEPNPVAVPPAPALEQIPVAPSLDSASTPGPYPGPEVPPQPEPYPANAQPLPIEPVPPGPPPVEQPPTPHRHRPTTTTISPEPPAPPPATAAAPDEPFLFPGESPPPPWNADPAVVQAWWDNHSKLRESWLQGR